MNSAHTPSKAPLAVLMLGLCVPAMVQASHDDRLSQFLSLSLEELMHTTVTISTNTKQALSKAPSVVSVITQDDIQATGATNISEILKSIPGVYVRPNLFGFRPQISFRGGASTQTLLMVNGVPQRDLVWNSGIFWRGLPTTMIDHIEVIRGPGSALYGSDASAGVINIITKTAGKIEHTEAGLRLGTFNDQEGWIQHSGLWNGFDVGMTAQFSHTDGHQPHISYTAGVTYPPGHADYGYENTDLRLSVSKGHWQVLADYLRKDNIAVGLVGGGALDPLTRGQDSRLNLQLLYDNPQFSEQWGLNAELRYYHMDYTSGAGFQEEPAPALEVNNMRSAERGLLMEASGIFTGFQSHEIRIGGGYSVSDLYDMRQVVNGVPQVFVPEQKRQIGYVYAQDIWSFAPDWTLTTGLRYDHYSKFGGTLNPRLALVWQTTDRLTSKLMYGQAFRAPSLLETAALTGATTSNPNLVPEETKTWDLSFSYLATKDLKLGLGLYEYAQSNPILVVSGQYENTPSKTVRGIELEAQWQATPSLRLSGNVSHRNQPTPAVAVNPIPKHQAYLRTDWAFSSHWNWNMQANWVGKQDTYDSRPRIGATTFVDTTLRYSPNRNWAFAASIRNLFDEDGSEYSRSTLLNNLPLPGRHAYLEARYQF